MKATGELTREITRHHPEWQLPDFQIHEFRPKRHKYCVCVFTINEGDKFQKQITTMKKFADRLDIIVADGGSSDDSVAPKFLKSAGVKCLLTKTGEGKLGAQMRMAFAYALNAGYEGVITIDGNGKDDIAALPDFIRLLNEGYDHIQGSRFMPGGKAINTPLSRLLAVRLVHAPMISIASRHRHTDTTNGFRAYSRRLLQDPQIAIFRDVFKTYELHYHLSIESARAKKFRLIETPVTRSYPKHGKTPTKISPVKGNVSVSAILWKAVLGFYRKRK